MATSKQKTQLQSIFRTVITSLCLFSFLFSCFRPSHTVVHSYNNPQRNLSSEFHNEEPSRGVLTETVSNFENPMIYESSSSDDLNRYGPYHTDIDNIQKYAYSPFQDNNRIEYVNDYSQVDYVEGKILIKLKEENVVSAFDTVNDDPKKSEIPSTFVDLGILSIKKVFPNKEFSALMKTQTEKNTNLSLWYEAEIDKNTDPSELALEVIKLDEVEYAEPELVRTFTDTKLSNTSANPKIVHENVRNISKKNLQEITDPLYSQQWYLENTKIQEAWDFLESQGLPAGGSEDIIIAVLDTGVDYNHPDLQENMWVNSSEFNGLSGVDDDGNGIIDDIYGINSFLENGNPMDDFGHGTHVAGIIAARANNNIGITGIAHNSKIMAIKVSDYSSFGTSAIARGIYYAVENGADIINMSFGSYGISQIEEEALLYAFSSTILVAAAGNDNFTTDSGCEILTVDKQFYPAAYPWVIGVMASDQNNQITSFSNKDCNPHSIAEYEVMAPGVNIPSTIPNNGYTSWDGTSMAAPVVSAIAALARTYWADKSIYSSRFIMGQIASTGDEFYQTGYGDFLRVNALNTLSNQPNPDIYYLMHWTFDNDSISDYNDNDGYIDNGETIDLGIRIRNHWGIGNNVTVKLEAIDPKAVLPDPYITFITDTVNYGSLGSFSWNDNGITYNELGEMYVENPFRFIVSPDTPNNHVIPIKTTITAENGLDQEDPSSPYSWIEYFYLISQKVEVLPRYIFEDTILDKSHIWIINGPVDAYADVTILPGTQVLCGLQPSNDPWAPPTYDSAEFIQNQGKLTIEGTLEEPVEIFPNPLTRGDCEFDLLAQSTFNYLNLASPYSFGPVDYANHVELTPGDMIISKDAMGIYGDYFENIKVNNFGFENSIALGDYCDTCLFSQGNLTLGSPLPQMNNSVILNKNLQNKEALYKNFNYFYYPAETHFLEDYEDHSYLILFAKDRDYSEALNVANLLGGYPASINSADENIFLTNYLIRNLSMDNISSQTILEWISLIDLDKAVIGLVDDVSPGDYYWQSKEPIEFTNGIDFSLASAGYQLYKDGTWRNYVNQDNLYFRRWSTKANVYILEIPKVITQNELNLLTNQINIQGSLSNKHNAFLDSYWNPPVNQGINWMDIRCGCESTFTCSESAIINGYFVDNYFGNAPLEALDYMFWDVNDDFLNKCRIVSEPQSISEDTYPYVVDITFSDSMGNIVTSIGKETLYITVTFNRDMDINTQPVVGFGPDYPYTDYNFEGDWVNERQWQGSHLITELNQGMQYIMVGKAVAKSDAWLTVADDMARFGFEVFLHNPSSMMLQAFGIENAIELKWVQDDFDLLAGYNLYRRKIGESNYTKINTTIIPKEQKFYLDRNITPNQTYYYKYSIIKTDLVEAYDSNISSAAAKIPTLPNPTLIDPENQSIEYHIPIKFEWIQEINANLYNLQISESIDFQNPILDIFTESNIYEFNSTLIENKSYFWRVKSISDSGNSDWSEIWIFVHELDEESPDTEITSSPPNPSNNSSPIFHFLSPDSTAVFECSLDGSEFSNCQNPFQFINISEGSHTFYVRAIDPAGNIDNSPASYSWELDLTRPSVVITKFTDQLDPTNQKPIKFSVKFSESIIGFSEHDVSLVGSTFSGVPIVHVDGSDNLYNITIDGIASSGEIILTIPEGSVFDLAGNSNFAGIGPDNKVKYDYIFPSINMISRLDSNPNLDNYVSYSVRFEESVTGVDLTDFELVTNGLEDALLNNISGDNDIYTLSIFSGSGSGIIRINLIDDDSITDLAGNPLGGDGFNNGSFYSEEFYNIRPPQEFSKISPNDEILTEPSVMLRWNSSEYAINYEYCLETNEICSTWNSTNGETSVLIGGLFQDTVYYWQIRAINEGGIAYADGSSQDFFSFKVMKTNPIPNLVSLDISSIEEDHPELTISISGTNFINSSEAYWDDIPLETDFANTELITVLISSDLLLIPGEFLISVINPSPGGGQSNFLPFLVKPEPQITPRYYIFLPLIMN